MGLNKRRKNAMKRMKSMYSLLIIGMLLSTNPAAAVEYKSTYKGMGNSSAAPRTEHQVASTAATPAMGFQSTSPMPVVTTVGVSNTLNDDGTVNSDAYGIGRKPGLRKDPIAPPPNPEDPDDEEDDGNTPIGDGAWLLVLLACAYMSLRAFLKRKRA
jgi:hypothetical protein